MSSNYTGNPTGTQPPGSTPALGGYPIVVLPSDGDALNAASVAQAWKECADYIAFAQLSINQLLTGLLSVKSLTLDGVGGATVGLTAGQLNQARSTLSDSPYSIITDQNSSVKFQIDHNGLPTSNGISTSAANWGPTVTTINPGSGGDSSLTQDHYWTAYTSATNPTVGGATLSSTYNSYSVGITGLSTTGDYANIRGSIFTFWDANTQYVIEFDFAMSTIGANNCEFDAGLGGSGFNDPTATSTNLARFIKASTDTNWKVQVCKFGGSPATTTTSIPPVANVYQQFRIEYQGANTPIGISSTEGAANTDKLRFFINGTRVATYDSSNSSFPVNNLGHLLAPFFGGKATASTSSTCNIGAVNLTWMRYLTPSVL